MKIGEQIAEVLRAHNSWPKQRYRSEAEALLDAVRLTATDRRIYNAYPHQLSGGQQQRVVIAQALSCDPQLIVADEPTASLDAETEAEILQLLADLKSKRWMALILITHDPRILHTLADRVAVLYAGRVIEDTPARVFFDNPQHPYSRALLACAAAPQTGASGIRRRIRSLIPSVPMPGSRRFQAIRRTRTYSTRLRICPALRPPHEQVRLAATLADRRP